MVACRRVKAQLCLSTCGDMRFVVSESQCRLAAWTCFRRMYSTPERVKDSLTATEIFHQASPSILEVCLGKRPLRSDRPQRIFDGSSSGQTPQDYADASSTRLLGLLGWVGDQLSLGSPDLRKNIQRISLIELNRCAVQD